MTTYRKKPVLVEARQVADYYEVNRADVATPGDYILTHADGSLEVMSKERFENEYEKAE